MENKALREMAVPVYGELVLLAAGNSVRMPGL